LLPVEEEGCVLHKVVYCLVAYSVSDMNMAWLHSSLWQIHFCKWLNLSLIQQSYLHCRQETDGHWLRYTLTIGKKHLIQEKCSLICMQYACYSI